MIQHYRDSHSGNNSSVAITCPAYNKFIFSEAKQEQHRNYLLKLDSQVKVALRYTHRDSSYFKNYIRNFSQNNRTVYERV
jgi:hypothetical protein